MFRLIAMVLVFGALAAAVPALLLTPESSTVQISKPASKVKPPANAQEIVSVSSGSVRLKPDARGHYVAEFKMNGRPVKALVDTGASMVAINKSTARRLGINVSPADFIYEVNTANGKAKVAPAMIREIEIGRVRVRDVEAAIFDDRALEGTLLGMTFLKRLQSFSVNDGDLILKQ
jgi:aspartyl protease family protein